MFEKITRMKLADNRIRLLDQRRYAKGNWESNRSGFLNKKEDNPFTDFPCCMPFFRTVIGWDGNVRICPHDMIGSVPLGNIKESRFLYILNSNVYTQFREKLSLSRKDLMPCKHCNVDGSLKYALLHFIRETETKSILKQLKNSNH